MSISASTLDIISLTNENLAAYKGSLCRHITGSCPEIMYEIQYVCNNRKLVHLKNIRFDFATQRNGEIKKNIFQNIIVNIFEHMIRTTGETVAGLEFLTHFKSIVNFNFNANITPAVKCQIMNHLNELDHS